MKKRSVFGFGVILTGLLTMVSTALGQATPTLTVTNTFGTGDMADFVAGTIPVAEVDYSGDFLSVGIFGGLLPTQNTIFAGGQGTYATAGLGGGSTTKGSDNSNVSGLAGFAILRGGELTASSPSAGALEGVAQLGEGYLGATVGGVGYVMCGSSTTTFTVTNCSHTAPAVNIVGIATNGPSNPIGVVSDGTALVQFDGSVTINDIACMGTSTDGMAHDNGTTACSTPGAQLGVIVAANSGTITQMSGAGTLGTTMSPTLALVQLHIGGGGPTGPVAKLNTIQTFTAANAFSGAVVLSASGAASTPGVSITGAPFTGGSGTTTLPQTYLDASANNPTGFSTSGTMFGINAPSGFTGNLVDFFIGSSTPAQKFTINSSGFVSRYNGNTTVDLGIPSILGTLDQTGVSTLNSGVAQNVLGSTPAAGHYRLFYYADESSGCVTIGSATFTISAGWTDATHARVSPTTSFTPASLSNGTGLFTQNTIDFWAAASTAVTVTATYGGCSGGTWKYDLHAYVEEVQ